jgi:DNA primase
VSEGGLDVLAWERAEIPATSPVGTDFTIQHATVLQTLGFTSVTVCFDGDEGGRKAVPSAVASLLAAGFLFADVHVIDLSDGDDPDDLSIDAMQRAYDCPISPVDFVLGRAAFFREHTDRVSSLLLYVPEDAQAELGRELGIDVARLRERAETSASAGATPGQCVVRAVLSHANACAGLAAEDVRALLADEPHLLASLRGVVFGERTQPETLPPALTHALARARYDAAVRRRNADAELSLWRYGESMADYSRAFDERRAVEEECRAAKLALAEATRSR